MDSKWQVLDLSGFEGFIGYERGRLVAGDRSVPLAEVDFILLGMKCTWGFGLMAGLERFDVGMTVCDWKSMPISVMLPWSENTRVCARHRAQATLSEPRRKNAWMRIIRAKISAHSLVLRTHGFVAAADELADIASRVRSGDPMNLEAHAARLYWSVFLGPGRKFRRDADEPDPANQMLNYGYTILRSRVVTRIVEAGLSPTLALFHHSRGNVFALADDLIEPFRPVVDARVWQVLNDDPQATITPELKASLVGLLTEPVGSSSLRTEIASLARAYARYAEGDIGTLPVPIIDPIPS
ncbi:type II CRISPR-associated endonuclease Cas1 [uncultured Kocuria sp.]|uniref:type II CRISPR-associated endonuclease Cas1 n=1 Tax=uncultured Kocuria sp. TaxID=259305 RepID=UPI002599EEC9|nr:type II CRISPR-associated endonuclease Cas1 [uncultured Kocuria sp.]MCT1367043.1 type II CRISPR-associated endonuclease Cas1 [Rothia sp. p3-SID1597]